MVGSQWTCRVSHLVWGEIYAILGTDPNKVKKKKSLLVNKICLQSGKIQGILFIQMMWSPNSVFIAAFLKTVISLDRSTLGN